MIFARLTPGNVVGVLGVCMLAWGAAPGGAQAQVGHRLTPSAPVTEADFAALVASATPMTLTRDGPGDLPAPQSLAIDPAASEGPMRIHPGAPGRGLPTNILQQNAAAPSGDAGAPVAPMDVGAGNLASIYHYSDYLQAPYPVDRYPYRAAGKLFFTLHGFNFVCTAALIAPSIIVTAGHCTNDGAGEFDSSAVFVPAYSASAGDYPFGYCSVTNIWTTPEWNSGLGLAFEYDVAVALCGPVEGASQHVGRLIGRATGWLGFCWRNCRMPYFQDTQIGYPVNYYGGGEMTISHHLAETVSGVIGGIPTGGYVHGSGMGGGSSGGPHVLNPGEIDETSTPGELPDRNVTLAVTSFSVGGVPDMLASIALTGANNTINFRLLYNLACRESRRTLGRRSCDLIR